MLLELEHSRTHSNKWQVGGFSLSVSSSLFSTPASLWLSLVCNRKNTFVLPQPVFSDFTHLHWYLDFTNRFSFRMATRHCYLVISYALPPTPAPNWNSLLGPVSRKIPRTHQNLQLNLRRVRVMACPKGGAACCCVT